MKQPGHILAFALVVLGILFTLTTVSLQLVHREGSSANRSYVARQALNLAEAGIDHAIRQLNTDANYAGEANTSLGDGTFTVAVTGSGSSRTIEATGYVPNSANPIQARTVKAEATLESNSVEFHYGIQVGNGGFIMNGGSSVNGSVYSNGSIDATTGVTITGSAVAANPIALTTDQTNDAPTPISSCTASTCITFGNAAATQDFAQSFQISESAGLNNVQLYLRKVGSPGNITIRVVNDASGSPSTDTLMTGSLIASTVTTTFGWVTATLPNKPVLTAGQTYWLVLDAGNSASNYYTIGANSSYASGAAKIGNYTSTWSNTTPNGLDGYFRLAIGGGTSLIGGNTYTTGVNVGDIAWAHTVQGATVTGTLYCQIGTYTNKPCNTSRPDPTPIPMPMSDNNIQALKDEAAAGGVINGNYDVNWAGATLGPKKIQGNLTVSGGGTLTMTGNLWITGSVTITGGGRVRLDASYGATDGALVTDGVVTISGGAQFSGSGTSGSYPFLITTSSCPTAPGCNGNRAITLTGGAGTVALVAQDGTVEINGGTSLKAVTARQISMTGGASLTYDSGLINTNFSSGPGGGWILQPGTWREVQ